ncbi:MAG: cell division FtsA domain-containing protein [bacterium]
MKLPFFTKTTPKPRFTEEKFLALDIGTEVLKIILFRCSDLGVHILDSVRILQPRLAMKAGVIQSLDRVLSNCKSGIQEIVKGLDEKDLPSKVVMGIAGELVHGVSIVVNYSRKDRSATEVNLSEQNSIYEKVKEKVMQDGRQQMSVKYGISSEDIEILHITITGLEIGEMPVDSLVGFTGDKVKLHFYASFAPCTYVDSLRKVAGELGLEIMEIVSLPFAMARVMEGSSQKNFSGIFVDVGGGTTDVALVEKGSVSDTQIYAFGGRIISKRIATEMNLDYRHGEERKIRYSNGELDSNISSKVRSLISKDLEVWAKGLRIALSNMEGVDQYPPFIYLCGGGALLPDVKRAIIEYPWTKELRFMRFPKVYVMTPEKLDMVIDKKFCLKDAMDITPAGLARFAWDRIKYPERHYFVMPT